MNASKYIDKEVEEILKNKSTKHRDFIVYTADTRGIEEFNKAVKALVNKNNKGVQKK